MYGRLDLEKSVRKKRRTKEYKKGKGSILAQVGTGIRVVILGIDGIIFIIDEGKDLT